MRCDLFSVLIDRHLAGGLAGEDQQKLREHLDSCADCRLLLQMRQDGLSLDEGREVPAAFSSAWRQAIREEEAKHMDQQDNRKVIRPAFRVRRWMAVAASLVLLIGGTMLTRDRIPGSQRTAEYETSAYPGEGRGAGASYMADASLSAPRAMNMDGAESLKAVPAPEREAKVIKTIDLSINTRSFSEDLELLNAAIKNQGGFVEYSNVSAASAIRRNASITARIPKDKLDSFLKEIEGVGQLGNRTESQQDVSDQYYDVDTRLKTQQAKMERLQDLLSKARTVEDILNIENQIADTQYQIDSLTGSLRGIDSKVQYSTVRIELREQTLPAKPEKPSLLQRLGEAIADAFQEFVLFLQDVLFFVIAVLPYLVVIIVLTIVVRLVLKRRKKK